MASEDDKRSSLQRPDDESHYRQVFRNFTTAGNARLHVGNSYVQYDFRIPLILYVAITICLGLLLAAYAGSLKDVAGAVAGFRTTSNTNEAPFMVPFARDVGYIPRSDITERLKIGEDMRDHHRTALYGMGGVGKTQLAVDYAYDFHARHPDVTILWLYASTFERFQDEYVRAGRLLGLLKEHTGNTSKLELVFDHLSDFRNGKWLIVIDNMDVDWHGAGPTPLDYIPKTLECRAILTTRDRNVAEQFAGDSIAAIAVDVLSSEQAYQLVVSALRTELVIPRLVATLGQIYGCLPLALSQAIAYMNYFGIPLDRYLSVIHTKPDRLLELHAPDLTFPRDSESSHNVHAAFSITFDRLSWRHPRSAFLLKIMAYFDTQSVPETLLRSYAFPGEQDFAEAMGILLALSLVSRTSEGYTSGWVENDFWTIDSKPQTPCPLYSMHRLVSIALRNNIRLSGDRMSNHAHALEDAPSGDNVVRVTDPVSVATLSLTKAWRASDDDLCPHAYRVLVEPVLNLQASFERALLWHFFGECLARRPSWTDLGRYAVSQHEAFTTSLSILDALPEANQDRVRRLRWHVRVDMAAAVLKAAPDKGPGVLFHATLNTSAQWQDILSPLLDCIASTLEFHLLQEPSSEDTNRKPILADNTWALDTYRMYCGVSCEGQWAVTRVTGDVRRFPSATEGYISFMMSGCSNPTVEVAAWYSAWAPNYAFRFDAGSVVSKVRGKCGAVVSLNNTYVDASGFPAEPVCGRSEGPRLGPQSPARRPLGSSSLAVDGSWQRLGWIMDFLAAAWTFLISGWSQVVTNSGSLLVDTDDDDEDSG